MHKSMVTYYVCRHINTLSQTQTQTQTQTCLKMHTMKQISNVCCFEISTILVRQNQYQVSTAKMSLLKRKYDPRLYLSNVHGITMIGSVSSVSSTNPRSAFQDI